ncbi:MAG TPA: FAD-dependent monooxygenase [Baekduia sp.]|nr:FAD-dependent monooxygenase [Baekduia sp.]
MTIDTDVLIVGAGPSGLTAAALLAEYGIDAITVSKHPGTADSPRAHITNQRTMEIFRELGFEQHAMAVAMSQREMGTQVFATSFAGTELARMQTWGAGVDRRSEYEAASPCQMCNAPQHVLEPVILDAARRRGAELRFSCELVEISQGAEAVTARVRQRAGGDEQLIRARYAIGADGARSTVAEQIGFPFEGESDLGKAFTVWLEADLTKYTRHRSGALFFVCEPGSDMWLSAWTCVKPWTEWNPLFLPHDPAPGDVTEEAVLDTVRRAIGDPDVAVRIKKISTWDINHVVASDYRRGRVFLVGDAAHRHPPSNGLGSNTSIQDSYNLAWKLALVVRGVAGDRLLDTYHEERQPVGRQVIDRAIQSVGEVEPLSQALGLGPGQSQEEAWASIDELFGGSTAGAERRAKLVEAQELMNWQFNCHGVELGQRYTSGAVVEDGTPWPQYDRDAELHYHPTTHPGAYLPHVWLERGTEPISTLDLAGHGRFAILTGVGGEDWIEAATEVGGELGVEIVGRVIGMRQACDDVEGAWARRREISDGGCLLVRPDRHIAWRSQDRVDDPPAALRRALVRILARDDAHAVAAADAVHTTIRTQTED